MSDKIVSTSKLLTVVVLAHPVRSHPKTSLIDKTLDSLRFLKLDPGTRVVISHDYPSRKLDKKRKEDFHAYLNILFDKFSSSKDYLVTTTPKHSFLSGNIRHSLKFVNTKYVLFVQHDLAFAANVNIHALLSVMESSSEVRHVRFNKRPNNIKEGWDFRLESRRDFVQLQTWSTNLGELQLLKTLAWSDQNHISSVSYYKDLVLPLCASYKTYPEDMLNPFTCRELFGLFGNYVYGGYDSQAYIEDLDGSKGRWDEMSKLDAFKRKVRLALHYRVNKLKIYRMVIK